MILLACPNGLINERVSAQREARVRNEKLILEPSDPAELVALRSWLETMARVRVEQLTGPPAPGEQGGIDYLEVIASSGGLIAAIRMLPEFLRARRSSFRIRTRLKDGREFVLEVGNASDLVPVLERLLDDDS
jgi:hypothetical protein